MSKDDFTNNEIKMMFQEIKHTLERVESQVIKTNGRVTLLEMWREGLTAKITMVIAAVSVGWIAFKELILTK